MKPPTLLHRSSIHYRIRITVACALNIVLPLATASADDLGCSPLLTENECQQFTLRYMELDASERKSFRVAYQELIDERTRMCRCGESSPEGLLREQVGPQRAVYVAPATQRPQRRWR